MELVKHVYSKNHCISKPMIGHDFRIYWLELFQNSAFLNDIACNYDHEVAGKLNMLPSAKEFLELKSVCSKNNLECGEVKVEVLNMHSMRDITSEAVAENKKGDIMTFNIQKKQVEKRNMDSIYRNTLRSHWRYVFCPEQSCIFPTFKQEEYPAPDLNQEVVFIVQIFRPISATENEIVKKHKLFPRLLDQVICVLGNQPLTALRDKIVCCTDHTVLGEFSEDPGAVTSGVMAKDVVKSAFFYINDTFYNDLRSPACVDYSSQIVNYAREPGRSIGPFFTKAMEEVTFQEVKLQLGYPYLYQHQGSCEHIIVFSDIRLLNPKEIRPLEEFPITCRVIPKRRVICMICEIHTAKWVTYGNKRLSSDPYFFCDMCFQSFNYDVAGNRIGDFRAYCFIDRSAI